MKICYNLCNVIASLELFVLILVYDTSFNWPVFNIHFNVYIWSEENICVVRYSFENRDWCIYSGCYFYIPISHECTIYNTTHTMIIQYVQCIDNTAFSFLAYRHTKCFMVNEDGVVYLYHLACSILISYIMYSHESF